MNKIKIRNYQIFSTIFVFILGTLLILKVLEWHVSIKGFQKHKYSVPIKYIGEYLTVTENEDTLNIYYTTDLIACHKISRKISKLQKRTCSWNIKIWCFKK